MRKIVLPGEKIADREIRLPNTFTEHGITYAAVVGMLNEEGMYIALEARYKPVVEDTILGIVTDVRQAGYNIDINLPYLCFLPSRSTRIRFEIGDIVAGKVGLVDEIGNVDMADAKKLPRGKIVEFPPAKVPRLIGRKSSMVSVLKEAAGGDIIIGNNGYVWLSEDSNIPLILKAMNLIIQKAHFSGLTDEVTQFLKNEKQR